MNVSHENGCKCVICSGEMTRKELTDKESQFMKEYGWYAHMVVADPFVVTGFNYHTHGFDKSLEHLDLQIVFPLSQEHCHSIASTIYEQIRSGKRFGEGDQTEIPSASRFLVRFLKVREGDRDVLRVIMPNSRGHFEPKDVAEDDEPEYALQWTVTTV